MEVTTVTVFSFSVVGLWYWLILYFGIMCLFTFFLKSVQIRTDPAGIKLKWSLGKCIWFVSTFSEFVRGLEVQLLITNLPPADWYVYQYKNIVSVPRLVLKLYVLLLVSTVVCINYLFLFFLLNLPPAEHGIISSSSSPREQNVALGIKLFNYSVSYRLANLTHSHLAPWTHQWYVCLHIRVCAACVGPGVHYCSCVWALIIVNGILINQLHSQSTVIQLRLVFMHAVVCVSHVTCCYFL